MKILQNQPASSPPLKLDKNDWWELGRLALLSAGIAIVDTVIQTMNQESSDAWYVVGVLFAAETVRKWLVSNK